MSHPARLSLRAPPHLPFIQGWPGIPPTEGGKRVAAGISGTVEVRVGAQAVKAKWVRVEIRRHEQLPPGFPSTQSTWEHVGEINTLWSSPQGKEYDQLDTSDFRFFLPLPETTPPSVEMMKGSGVRYELVAALCYKRKGGIFKSDSAEIIKISEPLSIIKHELHSTWPVYNNPDSKAITAQDVTMTVQRPGVAFGPGDRILLTASIRSSRGIPFKLRGFECTLMEVVTMYAVPAKEKKKKGQAGPVVKSRPIAQARCAVDESVGRGGEKSARIDMAVPVENLLVTVRHAKTLEVGYELQVKAVCDGFEGPTVSAIRYVVGLFSKVDAQKTIQMIGHVPALCPFTSPVPSRATSNSGSAPRPQSFAAAPSPSPQMQLQGPNGSNGLTPFPQGDWRRQSTSTITTTTADRNHNDWLPLPNNRPFSTLPPRHSPVSYGQHSPQIPQQQQQQVGLVPFPTASPAPTDKLYRSNSMTMSDYSSAAPEERPVSMQPLSEQGHAGVNRQSSATMATFGAWDRELQRDLQGVEVSLTSTSSHTSTSTRTMPNPYSSQSSHPFTPSATESEKVRLYDSARQSAAASHRSTGVPLNIVGLDDIPDTAPPEYAPPVPPIPAAVREERSRPGSMAMSAVWTPLMGSPSLGHGPGVASPLGSPGIGLGLGYSDRGGKSRGATEADASSPKPDATTSTVAGASAPRQSSPHPASAPAPSAISEKEQMRRYFEAKDKVERAARGEVQVSDGSEEEEGERAGPSGAGAGIGLGSGSGASHKTGAGAENAQSAGAGPSGDGIAPAIPLDQTHPTTSVGMPSTSSASVLAQAQQSQQEHQQRQQAPAGPSNSSNTSGPYMSAEQEKDLMRQRYEEATSRANRARSSPATHKAASPSRSAVAASPAPGSPVQAHASIGKQGQFNSAASSPRLLKDPALRPSTAQGSYGAEFSKDASASSSAAPPPVSHANGQAYMSAEQEKEMMRKRFEEAQARVDKAYGRPRVSDTLPLVSATSRSTESGQNAHPYAGSSTPASAQLHAPSDSKTGNDPGAQSSYPSAEQEKDEMRRRYEQASSRVVGGGAMGGAVRRVDNAGIAGSGTAARDGESGRPLPNARPVSMQPSSRSESVALGKSPPNGFDTMAARTESVSRRPDGSSASSGHQQGANAALNGVPAASANSLGQAGGAAAAPPPPLPARPPAEYINLLSPTTAPNKRFSFA